MTIGVNTQPDFTCNRILIKNSAKEKILGITIDNNLDFKSHFENICEVTNEKRRNADSLNS